MTEHEWLTSTEPAAMLAWIVPDGELTGRSSVGVGERKLRLFAASLLWAAWPIWQHANNNAAGVIAELERWADDNKAPRKMSGGITPGAS